MTTADEALYETVVFLEYSSELPDPSQLVNVIFPLDEMLLLSLLAVLAGAEALQVIAAAQALSPNEYLFASAKGNPLSDMGMAAVMKRQALAARPHGFRATFRTWVGANRYAV